MAGFPFTKCVRGPCTKETPPLLYSGSLTGVEYGSLTHAFNDKR